MRFVVLFAILILIWATLGPLVAYFAAVFAAIIWRSVGERDRS